MVIEGQRKTDGEDQEDHDHRSIDVVPNCHSNNVGQQDHGLRSHYVCQDCADKESFLAIE